MFTKIMSRLLLIGPVSMYKILVKTSECELSSEEEDFTVALGWANSMIELKNYGQVKSVEIFEKDKMVASLRTIK